MADENTVAAKKPATKTRRTPAKKTAPRATKPKIVSEETPYQLMPVTEAEKQAKLEAYAVLKNAGISPPDELTTEVEVWIKEEQDRRAVYEAEMANKRTEVEKVNSEGPWYVINRYNGPYSLRLERQDKKKRIELKPLGQRGDMHPLLDEDLKDPILVQNLEIGLIGLIPAGEAQLRSNQQVTNIRQPHTPLAILRNEKGEAYQQGSFKVEAEYNSQGVTVAYIDPEIAQGKKQMPKNTPMGDVVRPVNGQNPYQQQAQVSHFVPTGGNPAIISSGFPSSNQAAMIADDIARRKGGEGIKAGLPEGITVTVDPVRKS